MADELSPADEARLRRLLARSRHDEQVPDDVAARLDDVLARLEAGDEELAGPRALNTQLRELAARRRRTVVTGLVAAAAVVVVGIGLGQVLDDGLGTTSGDTAAVEAESIPEEAAAADRSEGRTDEDVAGGGAAGSGEAATEMDQLDEGAATFSYGMDDAPVADLLVVRGRLADVPEERFSRAALRLQRQVRPGMLARAGRTTQPLNRAPARVRQAWQGCGPVTWDDGTALAVLYDGSPAVMVFRTPTGDVQVVEILQCGTGEQLRSVTLPAG